MNEVDAYLEKVTPSQREILQHIREIINQLAPNAIEAISYGMPAYKINGKPLIYFAAFKDHLSIYPAGDQTVNTIEGLRKYKTSKGTLQFTETDQISDSLIRQLVELRLKTLETDGTTY